MRGVVGNESILDTVLVDHLMGNQNTTGIGLTEIQNGQNKSQSNKSFCRPKMSVEVLSCARSEKRDGLQENLILPDESGVRALKKITVFAAAAFMASTIGGVAQADTKMKCGCFDSVLNIAAVEFLQEAAGLLVREDQKVTFAGKNLQNIPAEELRSEIVTCPH